MALTEQLIKSNENLKDLSEDVVKAIVSLSVNDEARVINKKIGEQHQRLEEDILEITGLKKKTGEKSFEYAKRVLDKYKGDLEKVKEGGNESKELQDKIKELEKQLKDSSGDDLLKQKLKDAEDKANKLQKQYEDEKKAWEDEKTSIQSDFTRVQAETAFANGLRNMAFKKDYPEEIVNMGIETAKNKILEKYTPSEAEISGTKQMVFRDKQTGEIALNPEKGLSPFGVEELLGQHLKHFMDDSKGKSGSGYNGAGDANSGALAITDLSSAKTQLDANKIITKHLLSEGMTKGSEEFAEKQAAIYKENNITKLPIR